MPRHTIDGKYPPCEASPDASSAKSGEASLDGQVRVFQERHAEWLQNANDGGPVYCLPPMSIARLAARDAKHPPLIDADSAEVEIDFTTLGQAHSAIGFWEGHPIYYPCLQPPFGLPPEHLKRIFYPLFKSFDAEELMRVHMTSWERLRGYAGWLMCDPGFRAGRDDLVMRWQTLEQGERPQFPFALDNTIDALGDMEIAGERVYSKSLVGFKKGTNEFLRYWNLVQMTTWELPLPYGPLLSQDIWQHTQAVPTHGLHLVLPVHYPLAGSDELLEEITRQQHLLAKEAGLDQRVAALPHHELRGQMFHVQHLEQVITSRYIPPGRRGGAITNMEAAIAAAMRLSVDQVKKLRKLVSACRRGKRPRFS